MSSSLEANTRTFRYVPLSQVPEYNVFPGLKAGDFSCERLTFQPDTENI